MVSVDVPSGIDADTGRLWGTGVMAALTVTFGLPKVGLFLPPGEEHAGQVEVVDIGVPPHVQAEVELKKELITADTVSGLLAARKRDSHKGDFGHALIVAGSTGKTGAAALTAMAAARSGAGLVTLAVPASLNPILEIKATEVMTEPLPEDDPGFLSPQALDRIFKLAEGKSVVAVGPGISTKPGAAMVVRELVKQCRLPLVIDADGLNALAGSSKLLTRAQGEVVLTPHPGEMARLIETGTKQVQADRFRVALELAGETGAVVVLKGYRTVVAAREGRSFLNTTGGPHMASGGMGDVLTGMITGLMSQGLPASDAACLGVFAHGLAADQIASGPFGLMATDLIPALPGVWQAIQA